MFSRPAPVLGSPMELEGIGRSPRVCKAPRVHQHWQLEPGAQLPAAVDERAWRFCAERFAPTLRPLRDLDRSGSS